MLVHKKPGTINADNNVIEMMIYCDTHGCTIKCPYRNKCIEFELEYETLPCAFITEDNKPLTSL